MFRARPARLPLPGLILLSIALLLAACGDLIDAKPSAEKGLAELHERLNQEKFLEIYRESDELFRRGRSEASALEYFTSLRGRLGKLQSSQGGAWKVLSQGGRTRIRLQQEVTFERGKGTETTEFILRDGRARLSAYHLDSEALRAP